jgi:hypothetical protein
LLAAAPDQWHHAADAYLAAVAGEMRRYGWRCIGIREERLGGNGGCGDGRGG